MMRAALVALGVVAVTATGRAAPGKTEKDLMQIERDWAAAALRNDAAAVERIVADDYVGIDGRGVVSSKADEIAETRPRPAGSPEPERVIVADEASDMNVRLYGGTAVVTGISTERIRYQGAKSTVRYRRTTVYVKRQGPWQCVSFHGSRIIE